MKLLTESKFLVRQIKELKKAVKSAEKRLEQVIRKEAKENAKASKTKKKKVTPARRQGVSRRVTRPPFMQPMYATPQLQAVVGTSDPMPRTEYMKKVWYYVKSHGLMDKENRRMINADEPLKLIFKGKAKVSMFEMCKLISEHLKSAPFKD